MNAAVFVICGPTTGCGASIPLNALHCPSCGRANPSRAATDGAFHGQPIGTITVLASENDVASLRARVERLEKAVAFFAQLAEATNPLELKALRDIQGMIDARRGAR